MINSNDGNTNKKKFNNDDDFDALDELLDKNRQKILNSSSANSNADKRTTGEHERTKVNPQNNIVKRNPNTSSVSGASNTQNKSNTPRQNQDLPAKAKNPRQTSNKNIVAEAKIREGLQQERAEIFNKLENDEQYLNRHRTAQKNENDGSYRYAGRDIKSNRQKLVDVQPKSKARRNSGGEDADITVENKKRQKNDPDSDEYIEKSGFFLSGVMKAVLYIIAVIAISLIIALNIIDIANDVFAFVKPYFETEVVIPENANLDDVTEILVNNNLVKYPRIFELYIKELRKRDDEFVPGKYLLNSSMNYDEFIGAIRRRTNIYESVRITIPEGFTIDEIIDLFIANGIGKREKFVDIINNYEFEYKFIELLNEKALSPNRKYRLEGYLFPDTYDFYKNSSELQAIDKLLSTFNSKFSEDFYLECSMIGMTVDEVITLASIIEREARKLEDFPKVSSVFHNRLLNKSHFPYLEANATIQYSLGVHNAELLWMTEQDIALDLPYNTYKYPGLPPSAICNPGYEAVYAALEPDDTNYFFFVSRIDGTMLYASNSTQHANNIAIARSEAAQAAAQSNE